jgi:DNA-directed RNA polymerase subunit beta'
MVDKGEVIASTPKGEMLHAVMSGVIEFHETFFRILGENIVIPLKIGTILLVSPGIVVEPNKPLAEFDPFNDVVVTDYEGTITWIDMEVGKNIRRDVDAKTNNEIFKVMEQRRDKLNPRISVTSTTGITEEYTVPVDSLITLKTGEPIKIGDPLFKIPSLVEKTRDITGGLPRVD